MEFTTTWSERGYRRHPLPPQTMMTILSVGIFYGSPLTEPYCNMNLFDQRSLLAERRDLDERPVDFLPPTPVRDTDFLADVFGNGVAAE